MQYWHIIFANLQRRAYSLSDLQSLKIAITIGTLTFATFLASHRKSLFKSYSMIPGCIQMKNKYGFFVSKYFCVRKATFLVNLDGISIKNEIGQIICPTLVQKWPDHPVNYGRYFLGE